MPVRKSVLSGEELRIALLDGPRRCCTRKVRTRCRRGGSPTSWVPRPRASTRCSAGSRACCGPCTGKGFDRLGQHMRGVPVTKDVRLDLRRLGDAYRASAKDSPHLYSVMFERPVAEFECSDEDLEHALATSHALADGVQRAVDAGALHGAEAFDIAVNLWVAAHGFVSLELSGHLLDAPDTLDVRHDAVLDHTLAPYAVPAPV